MTYYYFIYDNTIGNIVFSTNIYITYMTIFFQIVMCSIHIYYSDLLHILKNIRLCRDRSFISILKDYKYTYYYGRFQYPISYILINALPTGVFVITLYYDVEFYFAYIVIIRFILIIIYVII